ncbi:DNA polymerase domain-containing protein [Lentisphaerota bacterium ZTH]|nr:ribonuclease H-like domain-containing protein [Lentisphaerota bacterium]WET06232.1 DNA polymerase domain-containing protein [Lentisphaerota bacterium ZTH]
MQLDKLVPSEYSKVVAVETGEDSAVMFIREGDKVSRKQVDFKPYLLLNSPELLNGSNCDFETIALKGEAPLKFVAVFPDVTQYLNAIKYIKQTSGFNQLSPNAPFRVIGDLCQQALIEHKFRLFRGMNFDDIRRMQFDIETLVSDGFDFPNPERADDSIIIITMSDNTGWEKVISVDKMSEKELLEEFVRTVQERDPDVLEGHNIFRFDLPYIETRAKRHKVKLTLGRENRLIKKRNSRFNAAERTINYTRYDMYGRHIIDTYHLCIFYDIIHRSLENYGLKYVARHFGVSPENRTYIDGKEITPAWHNNREELLKYALDDVRETRAISGILSPSYFYQTQLIPLKFQDCVVRGNATCIDSMLLSEYLGQRQSLSRPQGSRQFAGGLTKAFKAGTFKNVWHCDIRSLYPSIIIAEKWCPARDELKAFPRLLKELRLFRLEAKDNERKAKDSHERDFYNALQTTFKILINSFYGYLGFGQGTFNDYDLAERVTARGREILTMMLDFLESSGAAVIEMDTDGIYFVPPADMTKPEEMEKRVQDSLPAGIEVELDATYQAMFCYKSKNYALLEDNGEVSITGAALKSRGLEPFQRSYMEQLMELLLHEKYEELESLFHDFHRKIENREFPLSQLAKTETLNDSVDNYKKKMASGKGRRSAAYELAAASGRDYRRGDQVAFYITGNKKKVPVVDNSRLLSEAPAQRDENIPYYLTKLVELHKKFAALVPDNRQPGLF